MTLAELDAWADQRNWGQKGVRTMRRRLRIDAACHRDPRSKALVTAIQRYPGITEVAANDPREERWSVSFRVERSEVGWRTLEFFAWMNKDLWRGGYDTVLDAVAGPPQLNVPGEMLWFDFSGRGDPGEIARFVNRMLDEDYVPVGTE
jgi:hypothetical protein